MASIAVLTAACSVKDKENSQLPPITKPEITIEGGRLTPEGLWAMGRIGGATVDIETGLIAYTVSYYSVKENRSTTWIRICNPYERKDKNAMSVVDEFTGNSPAWFGGSGTLAFLRGGKLYLRRDGKEVEVSGAEDIDDFLLSPMRDMVVLIKQVQTVPSTSDKHPDLPLASGHVHEDLMYKHWDEWTETAPQPFIYPLTITYVGEGEQVKSAKVGDGVNILENTPFESPMRPFGGVEQLAWSPDEKTLLYTCRKKTGIDYALSTNSDIYAYNLETRAHENLTEGNMGYDTNPSYSPDGRHIAWLSMERDGYESDENRLMVRNMETGETIWTSKTLDSPVDAFYWRDNESLVFSSVWHGTEQLYLTDIEGKQRRQLTDGQYDFEPISTPKEMSINGDEYYCLRHSMCEANELYLLRNDGNNATLTQLTTENKNIYDQITMGTVIPRWQKTTDGKDMLTWIVLPPHFDPNKKYPALLYCEGGPQSPVSQFWSYRWNFMMMAANDYVVVAPNRRGLPGFGQKWNEEISGDYGGQCMRDYLTAIDEASTNLPYIDKNRLGCVGASFGGFSVYWLAGHHNKRFKAFIAHDGIFNMEMQYLETEEKWFANWDMGGAYWDKTNPVAQRTFANSPHKFVGQWDTPILCIHGERDYRILANQGMAAFDAARMRGIPAELLIFPDENHWVLKPQNGILWQRTFFEWLDRWLK